MIELAFFQREFEVFQWLVEKRTAVLKTLSFTFEITLSLVVWALNGQQFWCVVLLERGRVVLESKAVVPKLFQLMFR